MRNTKIFLSASIICLMVIGGCAGAAPKKKTVLTPVGLPGMDGVIPAAGNPAAAAPAEKQEPAEKAAASKAEGTVPAPEAGAVAVQSLSLSPQAAVTAPKIELPSLQAREKLNPVIGNEDKSQQSNGLDINSRFQPPAIPNVEKVPPAATAPAPETAFNPVRDHGSLANINSGILPPPNSAVSGRTQELEAVSNGVKQAPSVEPALPVEPAQPVEPALPVKPAVPVEQAQPVKPAPIPAETREEAAPAAVTAPKAAAVKPEPETEKTEENAAAAPKAPAPRIAPPELKEEAPLVKPARAVNFSGKASLAVKQKKLLLKKSEGAHPSRMHTVENGDNLESLAEKYYGDKTQWVKLYEANKDKIEKGSLKTGQVILIP